MWSIILVGFFNSIMFPSIFTLGIAKLGPRTGDGSGLLIMAIVGGAIIPVAQGAIADRIGVHHRVREKLQEICGGLGKLRASVQKWN